MIGMLGVNIEEDDVGCSSRLGEKMPDKPPGAGGLTDPFCLLLSRLCQIIALCFSLSSFLT